MNTVFEIQNLLFEEAHSNKLAESMLAMYVSAGHSMLNLHILI